MEMGREATCCFTGHRPNRLPWGGDEGDERCRALQTWLYCRAAEAYERGWRHYICGMAQGSDLLFAEAVLQLKGLHPDLVLEAAIPCPEQADRWAKAQRERYHRLLAQCDLETVVQRQYTPGCMLRRNRYMVDRSSLLLAVYDGTPSGGTARTIQYALRQGLELEQMDPNEI